VPFGRGYTIADFTGLVTGRLSDTDVMTPHSPLNLPTTYQIYQGRMGNHTRFFNYGCKANAQFQRFICMDTQRIVLVSRGIAAREEITVDYGKAY
jgi:SET domain-containing protein